MFHFIFGFLNTQIIISSSMMQLKSCLFNTEKDNIYFELQLISGLCTCLMVDYAVKYHLIFSDESADDELKQVNLNVLRL